MNVLVLGGSGRLGRRLVPALIGRGHVVGAPPSAECDATNTRDVVRAIRRLRPDVVVSLVAYADVIGCDRDPGKAKLLNVVATSVVAEAARANKVPLVWASTDYVVAGGPTPAEPVEDVLSFARLRVNRAGVYASTKNDGEAAALAAHATVARLAFCCPEDSYKWGWVDGYNVASREWVEDTAQRLSTLADFVAKEAREGIGAAGEIRHLGPIAGVDDGPLGPWRTREQLVRARFGDDHPALRVIVRSPAEREKLAGGFAPGDTRFASCDPRLALQPNLRTPP